MPNVDSSGRDCGRDEQDEKPFFDVVGETADRRWTNWGFEHACGEHTRPRVLNLAPPPNSPVPAIQPVKSKPLGAMAHRRGANEGTRGARAPRKPS
jgi:hypothetical protein